MKVTLEATGRFENVNSVRCRLWKGKSPGGSEIIAWIPVIALHKDAPIAEHQEWQRELQAAGVERQLVSIDMRLVL